MTVYADLYLPWTRPIVLLRCDVSCRLIGDQEASKRSVRLEDWVSPDLGRVRTRDLGGYIPDGGTRDCGTCRREESAPCGAGLSTRQYRPETSRVSSPADRVPD